MRLIERYGERWPRTLKNIATLKAKCGNPEGVYILYEGSMPLYIGKGKIRKQVTNHRKSKSKGGYWDYFSWYEIKDEELRHEFESVLLRILPFYLRSLNKNRGKLLGSGKMYCEEGRPEPIKKDYRPPNKKKS